MQETKSLRGIVWRMQVLGIAAFAMILVGIIGSMQLKGGTLSFIPSSLSISVFGVGVILFCFYFWWYKYLRCPKCKALLRKPKEQSTDTFIYTCCDCHTKWDTGIRNDGWL